MVLIDYDCLGLPVDLVRRAVPHLGTSPVYQLGPFPRGQVCEVTVRLSSDLEKAMLRVATVELVRALITTAAHDELGQRALHETSIYVPRSTWTAPRRA